MPNIAGGQLGDLVWPFPPLKNTQTKDSQLVTLIVLTCFGSQQECAELWLEKGERQSTSECVKPIDPGFPLLYSNRQQQTESNERRKSLTSPQSDSLSVPRAALQRNVCNCLHSFSLRGKFGQHLKKL